MFSEGNKILTEVDERANDRTVELLPMLMEKMGRRKSLTGCVRHEDLLYPYVEAQINLTRAKRGWNNCRCSDKRLTRTITARDNARRKYHSTPCTCWVTKR